jgi:hypothetical protein
MAEDPKVDKDAFFVAFMHFVPGRDDNGFERLLYTIALHCPHIFDDFGVDLAYISRTAKTLQDIREHVLIKVA